MKSVLIPAVAALALAACHPTAQDSSGRPATETAAAATTDSPAAPLEPASAPAPVAAENADFAGPLQAAGTEPFWGLSIRPDGMVLTRPDHPAAEAPNPGAKIEGKTAVWVSGGLKATLTPTHCSDGMSDRDYPYAATVVVGGTETLKGCARPVK